MAFLRYFISRTVTFLLVVWIGVTTVFFIPRLLPTNPIDIMLGRLQAQGSVMSAAQMAAMKASLEALFGIKGSLFSQYITFMRKAILDHNFGISLSNYPTPVSYLIAKALPWSMGLLLTSTIVAWIIGNLIGLIVGYRPSRWSSRIMESVSMFLYPIPYFIFSLILLILFTYIFPIFPISSTFVGSGFTWQYIGNIIYNSLLPALSIVVIGIGWWVISMKGLSSDIAEEDYVRFARQKGLKDRTVMVRYVLPNALLPQITVLALQLGTVFGGALITEVIFNYPGLGSLIYNAILQSDYNLIMGAVSLAILAIAFAAYVIDLVYPLFDPRIRLR